MSRPMWYRLDGHTPVAVASLEEYQDEWERRRQGQTHGADPWRVARTELDGERVVSTVFLGLDHQWMWDEPPLLFETMVFPECDTCQRYWTWEQAIAGHDQVVAEERRRS